MRCYLVQAAGHKRYAATQAEARAGRLELMAKAGVPKKDVTIVETTIPDDKAGKLDFINALCAEVGK